MASLGLNGWATDQGTVQNNTEAKSSCPSRPVKIPHSGLAPEPVLRSGTEGQGWGGPQGKDHSKQTQEQPQPLSKGPWALLGDPMQGGGTTRGVEVAGPRVNLTLM